MKISVIGAGYVGLVTSVCLAKQGHAVLCVDHDTHKLSCLREGRSPFFEPGLDDLLQAELTSKRLSFSSAVSEAVDFGEVIFICVGTPSLPDGSADLSYVEQVAKQIAEHMRSYKVVVDKSTVPVKTGERVKRTIDLYNAHGIEVDVVSNPEFLKEGSAVQDALHPDRIVVGVSSDRARDKMKEVYQGWTHCPFIVTDVNSAELIKHAANSFLAMKISYINAISQICELTGADIDSVAQGIKTDPRIGADFLNAGVGYGGSCFPKDVAAFISIAREHGYEFDLLKSVAEINESQWRHFVRRIEDALWVLKDKRIAVWGLSFKPNTDDMRSAPSLKVIESLLQKGAHVVAYDPAAMTGARALLPGVFLADDLYDAAKGADALLLLTEWDEFVLADMDRVRKSMQTPLLFDGRNAWKAQTMEALGFRYYGIGRLPQAQLCVHERL